MLRLNQTIATMYCDVSRMRPEVELKLVATTAKPDVKPADRPAAQPAANVCRPLLLVQ